MKTFKRFLDAGFNFQIKDSEVILREDEKIIFEIPFEEDNKIEDLIEENCNYHLKMISIKDPEYFEDADEYYLQHEWKDLILRIKHLVKGVEMSEDLFRPNIPSKKYGEKLISRKIKD